MRISAFLALAAALLLVGAGCITKSESGSGSADPGGSSAARTEPSPDPAAGKAEAKEGTVPDRAKEPASGEKGAEPDYITVQHCLVGFQGSVQGKVVTRSKAEAEKLARALYSQAKSGEDFDAIVKQYTDDSPPGVYKMSNFDAPRRSGVYARSEMVAAFGDVGFPLEVGEFGLAEYHSRKSPFGWHIIKRIE